MPSNTVKLLMEKVESIEKDFKQHLKESIGIQVQLKVNTILTGLMFAAVIGKIVADYWK
jgi:hypothetical protein